MDIVWLEDYNFLLRPSPIGLALSATLLYELCQHDLVAKSGSAASLLLTLWPLCEYLYELAGLLAESTLR